MQGYAGFFHTLSIQKKMIGIYINFNSTNDFESVESQLDALGGYEVGGNSEDEPCWKLCEYSVDGEESDFTQEECEEIRKKAEIFLQTKCIQYSITVTA